MGVLRDNKPGGESVVLFSEGGVFSKTMLGGTGRKREGWQMKVWKPVVLGLMVGAIVAAGAIAEEGGGAGDEAVAGKRVRKEGMKDRHGAMFDAVDKDADGKISLAEFQAFWAEKMEQRFKTMDGDGDGSLTKEEMAKRPPHHGRGPKERPPRKGDGDRGHRKRGKKDGDAAPPEQGEVKNLL